MKRALLIIFVLCLALVSAKSDTTSRFPNITATMGENVTLNSIDLSRSTGPVSINYNGSRGPSGVSSITLASTLIDFLRAWPLSALENRVFTFSINISDDTMLRNSALYNFSVNVSAPGQLLTLKVPEFGGFNTSDTDVVIESQMQSVCRWIQEDYGIVDNNWFLNLMMPMAPDGTLRSHTIKDLFNNTSTAISEGASVTISVTCNDTLTGILTPSVWKITYLNTTPSISVSANPNPIIDSTTRSSVISVSTNQETWCTLSDKGAAIQSADIFGPQSYDTYSTQHSGTISIPSGFTNEFNITVQCEDRAGITSNKTINITVDYSTPIIISMLSPSASNNRNYQLNYTTNIAVGCTVLRDGVGVSMSKNAPANVNANRWWVNEQFTADATYTYNISCSVPGLKKTTLIYPVAIDGTGPVFSSLDSPPLTCDLSKITFTFNATSTPPSLIDSYNYTIKNKTTSTIIASGKSKSATVTVANLKLTDDSEYIITGWVNDTAGNTEGPKVKSVKASTNKAPACDLEDPRTALIENKTASATIIRFICTDNVACKNEYRWKAVATNATCNVTISDTPVNSLNTTQTITAKSRVCWLVSDTSNRVVNAEQIVTLLAGNNTTPPVGNLCTNTKTDLSNLETDVDCGGGICAGDQGKKCANGKTCIVNADCIGAWCDFGTCKTASCTDNVKDGAETGVDCGSSCGPCKGNNTACLVKADCSAGKSCKQGVCLDEGELEPPEIEDPKEPIAKDSSFLSVLLIILGTLLMLGGIGTIVLYAPPKKKVEEDNQPIVNFEETALSREPQQEEQQDDGKGPERRKKRRLVKKQRRKAVLSEFESLQEFSEKEDISHKDIEKAYEKFEEKEFKETTKQLLEDGKVEKKDVAVAIADLAAKDKIDDDAIDELKKTFGITEDKEKEEKS